MWRVNYQESLPLLKKYRENSLPNDGPEMHRIRAAAKENQIFVSLGYSEVDLNSLYTTQIMINPAGDIINHRRKIRATHVERLVFGDGETLPPHTLTTQVLIHYNRYWRHYRVCR